MQDRWFTIDELHEIEQNAADNPDLRHPHAISIGVRPKEVLNISFEHGLILPQGNSSTGFEHIHARHEFFSFVPHWQQKENKIELNNPSRFSPDSTPILDYIKIADKLYRQDFLNNEKCNHPDHFDMYSGKIAYYGNEHPFSLLLYKGSKVIHALFPEKHFVKRKKPKNFHLFRGSVSLVNNVAESTARFRIPYLDETNTTVYSIEITKDYAVKKETAIIFIHDKNGLPTSFVDIGEQNLSPADTMDKCAFMRVRYEVVDLPTFEEWIKGIDEERSNGQS
jgi:hypothetical protein